MLVLNVYMFSRIKANKNVLKHLCGSKQLKTHQCRSISSRIFDFDDDSDKWPQTQKNYIINVCPEGKNMVVERVGKFHKVVESGKMFTALPFYDKIKYVIDMREKAITIYNQSATTKDQVKIEISCSVYCQFEDAYKAAYGSINPLYSIRQHIQTAICYIVKELELDVILGNQVQLTSMIKDAISDNVLEWGFKINRCELLDVVPDKTVSEAIAKHGAEYRERKHQLLRAESDKKLAEIESSAQLLRSASHLESMALKIQKEAEAIREAAVLKAKADVEIFRIKVAAQAEAIDMLATKLASHPHAKEAAMLALANHFISTYNRETQVSSIKSAADDFDSIIKIASKHMPPPPPTSASENQSSQSNK